MGQIRETPNGDENGGDMTNGYLEYSNEGEDDAPHTPNGFSDDLENFLQEFEQHQHLHQLLFELFQLTIHTMRLAYQAQDTN